LAEELTWDFLQMVGEQLDQRKRGLQQPEHRMSDGRLWAPTERDCFIERHLKIRTKVHDRLFFKLNRAQKEYSWSAQDHKHNIVLKARQLGITTYIAARFFVQTITQKGTLSMQVTHDRQSSEDIFRIVRRFWENMPEYLRKGLLRTSHRNSRQLVFPELDSEYCLASAEENAGRGRTIQNLHCSEVSRWGRRGNEALVSLRAAVVPGGEIVLESTANGAGGLFYEEWQGALETGYRQHFFPWWYDETYALDVGENFSPLTEKEKELVEVQGLSLKQIAWRRKQWASFRGLAVQEFAEDEVSCFRASGECVFDLESVEKALLGSIEPLEKRDNERLLIWLPPQPGREYVIGVDPSGGGTQGDFSCAQVIDRELGRQCAELHGHWRLEDLAIRLVKLAKEYNGATLAVERNNHGFGVLAHLQTGRYPNLFKQKGQDGWLTTVVSRPAMIENLSAALMDSPELFRSSRLLNEFRTFVRFADGNSGGAAGTHDDCVMAMAIAWAVRKEEAGEHAKAQVSFGSLMEK
jgi:hypothetical protein